MQPTNPAASGPVGPVIAPTLSPRASDAKLHATAKQFESVFMTEMLRLARPPANAAGVFAPGHAEKSWQVFMDQALGQAATAKDSTGLVPQIEKVLRDAQSHSSKGLTK